MTMKVASASEDENFRFAEDIVVNAEEEEEAGVLVDRLDRTTTRYKQGVHLSHFRKILRIDFRKMRTGYLRISCE